MLTRKGLQTLLRVERLMDEASRQLAADTAAAQSGPPAAPGPRTTPGRVGNTVGSGATATE